MRVKLPLALLQVHFFELLRFRQAGLFSKLVKATLEFVVLDGELMKLLVRLQHHFQQLLRLLIYAPPPW